MAVSIKIDDATKARVARLASQKDRSSHWIMREAIDQYLAREEAREDFYQEALQSWRDYRETGKHLDAEEVRAWLRNWGTDDEKALPACHD